MSEVHQQSYLGNFRHLAFGMASLAVVGVISYLSLCSATVPVNLEDIRGLHRLEVKKKIQAEEKGRLELDRPEWVNKQDGSVRLSLTQAQQQGVSIISAKVVKASEIKLDPVMAVPAGDAPAMPSAPSGAKMIRFVPIPTSTGEKR